MQYLEIYVASVGYQKREPLTYHSPAPLKAGTIVEVPFGRKVAVGFVSRSVRQPSFPTKAIIRTLHDRPLPLTTRKLFSWLLQFYPSGSGATAQLFVPTSLRTGPRPEIIMHDSPVELPADSLTPQQQDAVRQMDRSEKKHFLLHGETGSGKTRVYIERAAAAIRAGRSVIVLTPEISLTPQLGGNFRRVFGDRVLLVHSNLTAKQRREAWLRIHESAQPLVIIGPRSALFYPLQRIGLIVVDEMHETAYKQEQAPRYHAIRAAGAAANIHGAEIIYGSATPGIADYYLAEAAGLPIIRMDKPAKGTAALPDVRIVDLTDRTKFSVNRAVSDELLHELEATLARGEQALVFLNRRGTARLVLCQVCGWQAHCPNCDVPLTYHGDSHRMRCHTCGWHGDVPTTCPECQSTDLQFRTIGTKALTDTLHSLFPRARIQRFDTDVAAADQVEKHYEAIHAGEIDILVGTQMLGKGLDLPRLSLIGVISADTSLALPDYTANERGYQLLHQVLGRVGRGHRDGRVIIQTYSPDNAMLLAAANRDWRSFYDSELKERRSFGFPPYNFLLKVSVSRKSRGSAEKAITKLRAVLTAEKLAIDISDPAPSFYEHTHGLYHWQLIIRSRRRGELVRAALALPPGDHVYDLDPVNLL